MERIVTLKEEIRKFFFSKHLDFLTSVPHRRIQEIILSSCTRGNSGKLTDYAGVFPTHRTTYGHFLSKGKWDEEIDSIPDQTGAYFLTDSWYTNPDILHSCEDKGCFLIGAMKINRILYPNGQRTSAFGVL